MNKVTEITERFQLKWLEERAKSRASRGLFKGGINLSLPPVMSIFKYRRNNRNDFSYSDYIEESSTEQDKPVAKLMYPALLYNIYLQYIYYTYVHT